MLPTTELYVVGLMSGSSLDGLDIAYCRFVLHPTQPDAPLADWQLLRGQTLPYTEAWHQRLLHAPQLSGRDLWQLHTELGHYFGAQVLAFVGERDCQIDLIGSHGHTVFHFPEQGFTTQLGDGAAIAAHTGRPTIDQFRTMDIALGGQGAPLAPLADRYFFGDYDACLNLGGIANLSVRTPRGYVAFDIAGANQLLDRLAQQVGSPYDAGGELARTGHWLPDLAQQLDALDFLHADYPKSLDNGWVQQVQWPIVDQHSGSVADRLHTVVVQLAQQIGAHLQAVRRSEQLRGQPLRLLLTGGGAFNHFLVEEVRRACGEGVTVEVPQSDVAAFKEAAFIGLAAALRWVQLPNSFATVTGARHDAINGALYWPTTAPQALPS